MNLGATFGRLWETLGDSGGGFGRLWGDFVRLRGALGDVGGVFGESVGGFREALGKLWEPFRAFLLLAPSLPPLYIKKIKLPINRSSGPILPDDIF